MTTTLSALVRIEMIDVTLATALGVGATLLLACSPWFGRERTIVRLAPYLPEPKGPARNTVDRIGLRETLEPVLESFGRGLGRLLGIITDLPLRLRRAGVTTDPYDFRLFQVSSGIVALILAAILWVVTAVPTLLGVSVMITAPVVTVLGVEQWVNHRMEERARRIHSELPVVIEQLGMLVSAGFSLTAAVAQIASRGTGTVAGDLGEVTTEIRRGVAPTDAFRTWADTCGLPAVERVVAVLALNSEASDLGALVSAEARSIRASAHRELLETIEKRSQLVWIPVTVATLVPGLIFLAVPFYAAMAKVTGG